MIDISSPQNVQKVGKVAIVEISMHLDKFVTRSIFNFNSHYLRKSFATKIIKTTTNRMMYLFSTIFTTMHEFYFFKMIAQLTFLVSKSK